jgi:hypothetical protein
VNRHNAPTPASPERASSLARRRSIVSAFSNMALPAQLAGGVRAAFDKQTRVFASASQQKLSRALLLFVLVNADPFLRGAATAV